MNFLIDEAHLFSKGSNAVVSYLHYFDHFGLGETTAELHCNNHSGQNKNRYVLWYLAWRIAIGLHQSITLNFLIAGHTKFIPDWCFGLLEWAFICHAVSSLLEFESVICRSACVNKAQLVGMEDGACRELASLLQSHLQGISWNQEISPLQVNSDKPIMCIYDGGFIKLGPGTTVRSPCSSKGSLAKT